MGRINQEKLLKITASGILVRPTEARAINETNKYRRKKGKTYQRSTYVYY